MVIITHIPDWYSFLWCDFVYLQCSLLFWAELLLSQSCISWLSAGSGEFEVRSEQHSFCACCASQDHVGNACYTQSHGKGWLVSACFLNVESCWRNYSWTLLLESIVIFLNLIIRCLAPYSHKLKGNGHLCVWVTCPASLPGNAADVDWLIDLY